ncbi:MAG TPA: hypothetical protein PKC67_03835 [Kiritimatiellia bacterium]|nr:hypothetical protein [Kiritimatiellia bacterium]HMP33459.1 hypothetical protein [Kiritimatiellia bacterium]
MKSRIFGMLFVAWFVVGIATSHAQVGGGTVIFSNGFEGVETWAYTNSGTTGSGATNIVDGGTDNPTNARIRSGSFSWQNRSSGSPGTASNILTFASVDISASTNRQVVLRVASISGTAGNGAEQSDSLFVYVALDGAAFSATPEIRLQGNNNARWGFNATNFIQILAGSTVSNNAPQGGGANINNYGSLAIDLPNSATSVAVRVITRNNDAAEIWCIDDVEIHANAPGWIGPSENPPSVIVTTADNTVPFATTTFDVEGTANTNTVGDLIWTNALAGASGVEPAAASWTITAVPLAVGTNIIVVRGTNTAGVSSQDSVTVIRQPSPPPAVTITTPVQSVVNAISSIDIQGTANAETVGELGWTNALTGAAGTIPVAASWTVPGVALSVGANAITVRGSNAFGTVVSSSVTITRDAPVLPVGTNVQVRQGFEVGDTWPILAGGGFASTETGAAYTPANALIRTGTSSWQSVGSATNTLDLDAISIAGKTDVVVSVRLASISVNGSNGADAGDQVRVFVSLDGAAYADAQTVVRGNSNARWGYDAVWVANRIVEATPPNTNVATAGTSTNNYAQIRLFVPSTATSVAVRVVAINNAPEEIWAIDDIELLSSDIETGGSGFSQEQEDWIVANWGSIGAYPGDGVDSDLDGYLNVEEFIAGTNPTDDTSFFEVSNLTASGSPSVVITPSVTGRVYDVEATANLIAGSWTVIATNVPGTGASLNIPDTAGATSRAYRVVVELAP